MIRYCALLVYCSLPFLLQAQGDTVLARQCSAIRELIYIAQQQRFSSILDERQRGSSSGYQVNGQWTFSNEKFTTTMPWEGAAQTIIEHATDSRDTLHTDSWQYIASFAVMSDRQQAIRLMNKLVEQINHCVLPLSDSISFDLRPVDPEELPASKPDNLVEAYLFFLPDTQGPALHTSLMIGLERIRQGYRPLMILERLEQSRKE
jgi:hypothetical protein